jgi:hypothetical protein
MTHKLTGVYDALLWLAVLYVAWTIFKAVVNWAERRREKRR